MELTNLSDIILFRTKWETIFRQAYELATSNIDQWAFQYQSGRIEQVIHRWMNGVEMPREFLGNRMIQNLSTNGLNLINKKWELTVGLPRQDIERDQYGVFEPMTRDMAATAKIHRDQLGATTLSTALADPSVLAYDGQAFFGNHSTATGRAKAFNNKTTAVLNEASLSTAITQIRNRRNFKGIPLRGAQGRLKLLIHPSNELTAAKLANQAWFPTVQPGTTAPGTTGLTAAGENILKGRFDVVIEEFLLTETEWYLYLDEPAMFRPVLFQLEMDTEFLAPPTFFNSQWSDQDQWVQGTRAFYAAAVSIPEGVYASTGSP